MKAEQFHSDQEFINLLIQQVNHFQEVIHPKINRRQKNVFFFGKSGGGKSTLLNGLCGKKIIFQQDEGGFFLPIQDQSDIYFEIAQDPFDSMTQDPKEILLDQEYQLWDLPGYQDSRSAQEDLKNLLIKKLIIDNSNQSHIVILLPESQLTGDKGGFLIDILNILSEDNIIPTIIISFANQKLNLEYIQSQLIKFITNKESILSAKGKIILQKVVDQQRVLIFNEPVLIDNDNYEFQEKNLIEIRCFILQPQFFTKIQLKFLLLDDAKQVLRQICMNLNQDLIKWEDQILSGLIEIQDKKIGVYNQQDLFKIKQLEQINQELLNQQAIKLKNISLLGQFIEDFNQLEDNSLNLKQQFEIVVCCEKIVQQMNIIQIFCGQFSISNLKNLLTRYKNVDTVFIISLFSFEVNEDFKFQGLSIYIKTKIFIVTNDNQISINLSGKDGEINKSKKAGQDLNEMNGNNGINGNNGQNGGNFFIDSKEYVNMEKLLIDLSGGNGSDGQEGGDGTDGKNGHDAEQQSVNMADKNCEQIIRELDHYEYGDIWTFNKENKIEFISRGTEGLQGGNAGQGGLGGLNGLKGQFKTTNNQIQIKIVDKDGLIGKNGANGKVGQGGINGKDYSRKLKNIKFFEGITKESQRNNEVKAYREVLSLCTFATVQTVGSVGQKIVQNNTWESKGKFINRGSAQDGLLNPQFEYQLEEIKQSNFHEQLKQFEIFQEGIKIENKGKIYDHLF